MADFFKKEEPEAPAEPSTIKIGETEYSPEDLQGMVDLASKVKTFTEKAGTDFDSLTSSWGKRGEEIGRLKSELEEAKKPKIEPTKDEVSEEEMRRQIQEEARKADLVLKADLDNWFEEKVSAREQARDLLNQCTKLEKKIDGKDGRPAFRTEDVLEHMKETGIKNPQDAYDLKYKSELNIWKEKEILSRKGVGLMTEDVSSAGGKQPTPVKITRSNLDQMVKESLQNG